MVYVYRAVMLMRLRPLVYTSSPIRAQAQNYCPLQEAAPALSLLSSVMLHVAADPLGRHRPPKRSEGPSKAFGEISRMRHPPVVHGCGGQAADLWALQGQYEQCELISTLFPFLPVTVGFAPYFLWHRTLAQDWEDGWRLPS